MGTGWRAVRALTGALVAMASVAATLSSAPNAAASPLCQTRCTDQLTAACLPRLGAGAAEALDAPGCADQKAAYRSCLLGLVEQCDKNRGGTASQSWGATEIASGVAPPDPCALGRWTGWIVEPGVSSYTLELEVGARNGVAFARSWYPELACGGGGEAVRGATATRLLLAETITTNRDRCADGQFSLTCLGEDRLLWRWYRNNGESFDAVLTRR